MKAVISDRIYLNADVDLKARLRSTLTYKIPTYVSGKIHYKKECLLKIINKNVVSIPAGRRDLIPEGYIISDKTIDNPVKFPTFKFPLRESQQLIYDQVDSSCIINANPSWGKTFSGIAIATKLGQKTLIVVHTVFLREQWEKEIEKTLGINPGVIGSSRFDTDPPIVVANIQTLVKHFSKVNNLFGTIIIDEAHHTPSSTFFKILDSSKAKYKIGLSGTLERKDGYHVVLKDVFSPTVYIPPKENAMIPKCIMVPTNIKFNDDNSIPWAHRVTELLSNREFINIAISIIDAQIRRGHKLLVVSDRNDILHYLSEIFSDDSVCVVGTTSTEDRNQLETLLRSGKINIIFGSTTIFKEGISINCLSSAMSLTPINNDSLLEQLIGRICREEEGKKTPEYVDLQLEGRIGKKQSQARLGLYLKLGFVTSYLRNPL